jgi:O-acetyl-ADP-ribose deacetylase (regulator of RNase III)
MMVNCANKNFNLRVGFVSRSLLEVAGEELQLECSQVASAKTLLPGDIVVTQGFNLKSQWVCHGYCPKWDENATTKTVIINERLLSIYSVPCLLQFQILDKFLKNCLQEATRQRVATLAMSSIGAGHLKIPEREFLDTLVSCIESSALPYLKQVHILYDERKNADLKRVCTMMNYECTETKIA